MTISCRNEWVDFSLVVLKKKLAHLHMLNFYLRSIKLPFSFASSFTSTSLVSLPDEMSCGGGITTFGGASSTTTFGGASASSITTFGGASWIATFGEASSHHNQFHKLWLMIHQSQLVELIMRWRLTIIILKPNLRLFTFFGFFLWCRSCFVRL